MGVVQVGNGTFVLADVPGLIEGASQGRGLGDEFLRHVERTRVLIFVMDVMGFEGHLPSQAYKILRKELQSYSPHLAKRPRLVALNKMDLTDSSDVLKKMRRALRGERIFPISAVTGKGVDALLAAVFKKIQEAPDSQLRLPPEPRPKRIVFSPEFSVQSDGAGFRVMGPKVTRLVAMTDKRFLRDRHFRRLAHRAE